MFAYPPGMSYTLFMKQLAITILIMCLTGLSIFINLALLDSILFSFACYYLGFGILLPVIDLLILKRKKPVDLFAFLGLTFTRRNITIGLLFGILIFAIIQLVVFLLFKVILQENNIFAALSDWGISRKNIFVVFLIMLLFNGAMEEVYWRGYIHRRLAGLSNRRLALALPVLFFTAQHIVIILGLMPGALAVGLVLLAIGIGGVIWQLMREYTGSVVPCMLSHMGATAGYMTVFYIYVLKPV